MSNNSPDILKTLLNAADNINHTISGMKKIGMPTKDISDGYHTFGDLYHHRALLFASVLCIPEINKCAWKSKKHFDNDKDPMYDGMFIVGFTAELDGKKYEASYHYDIDPYWDKYFGHVKEIDHAPEFSGYTPEDSINTIYTVASYWFNIHDSERMWYEDDNLKKVLSDISDQPIVSNAKIDIKTGTVYFYDKDGNNIGKYTDQSLKESEKKEEQQTVTDAVIDHETGKISLYNSEKEKVTELSKEEVIDIASHLSGGAMGIIKGSEQEEAHKIAEKYDGTPTNAAGGGFYPWYGGCGGNGAKGSIIIFTDEEYNKPMPVYKFQKVKVHGSGIYRHLVLHRNSDGDYYFTNERK